MTKLRNVRLLFFYFIIILHLVVMIVYNGVLLFNRYLLTYPHIIGLVDHHHKERLTSHSAKFPHLKKIGCCEESVDKSSRHRC